MLVISHQQAHVVPCCAWSSLPSPAGDQLPCPYPICSSHHHHYHRHPRERRRVTSQLVGRCGHLFLSRRTNMPRLYNVHCELLTGGERWAAIGSALRSALTVAVVKLSTQPQSTVPQLPTHTLHGGSVSCVRVYVCLCYQSIGHGLGSLLKVHVVCVIASGCIHGHCWV